MPARKSGTSDDARPRHPEKAARPESPRSGEARLDPRARAGLRGLSRDARHRARPGPAHGLRRGAVPEHRRVLAEAPRDSDDHGRCVHARVRILQRPHRAARPARSGEPERVADAVAELGLEHVVITSVDRDDLDDGGGAHFAAVVAAVRECAPRTTIELLIPDFLRKDGALETVLAARPDVVNHNLETVPSLYLRVRPGRAVLPFAASPPAREGDRSRRCSPSPASWSASARPAMKCSRSWTISGPPSVDFLTVGQYLAPDTQARRGETLRAAR